MHPCVTSLVSPSSMEEKLNRTRSEGKWQRLVFPSGMSAGYGRPFVHCIFWPVCLITPPLSASTFEVRIKILWAANFFLEKKKTDGAPRYVVE